ncbi:hypothetical protein J4Q44_G00105620 [Coregonus suidteri]|uniref:Uncharacterized protein n=1 Tax=Coregonus suidteri TaxID=861788 RepID=A0AAN8MSE8_9TELE
MEGQWNTCCDTASYVSVHDKACCFTTDTLLTANITVVKFHIIRCFCVLCFIKTQSSLYIFLMVFQYTIIISTICPLDLISSLVLSSFLSQCALAHVCISCIAVQMSCMFTN